jgi:hypothetical protein
MKTFILKIALLSSIYFNAQIVYKSSSNIINSNSEKGVISLLPSFGVDNFQAQISYNITNKYNVFAKYMNSDGSFKTYSFFGDSYTTYYKNEGYSFGVGRTFNKINKQISVLIGFENQVNESYSMRRNLFEDNNQYKFYKIFGVFNLIYFNRKSEIGLSSKFSYFKIHDYISIEELSYNNESTLIITPVFVYNLNLTKDKKIKFCSQVGFSAMLSPLKAEINYENGGFSRQQDYLIAMILNVGLKIDISTIK